MKMPLPDRWNFKEDLLAIKRNKVVLSLRVIRAMLLRYC